MMQPGMQQLQGAYLVFLVGGGSRGVSWGGLLGSSVTYTILASPEHMCQ
jgi:hypothetical protein